MPTRRRFLSLAVLCLAATAATAATAAFAATAATTGAPPVVQLAEGQDYRLLTPARPTSSPGKIEVVEFFSYACPHCARFNPLVSAWAAKLPKDVAFRRIAVTYGRPPWMNLSRTYYALEATGDLKRLDAALFHAIHDDHQNLFDEQPIADWVAKQGGDANRFASAYVSFGVNSQTVQADVMAEDYAIEAVPTLAVDGRYVVISPGQSADEDKTFRELLVRADKVIAMARAAAPRAAPPAAAKAHGAKASAANPATNAPAAKSR